ncbi:hypothetical protein E2562_031352 [Oryza meyeriana var. granulata]|uniref:Uncharacterized protein n=1 Tax=Oryza meyeriana var. granulata TaxID=110450 RepID=A0A6G1D9K6_9ORYZ|nr:hypothetical protein E2562_031352 [Oryza meyeriana var. granulata]
MPQIIATDGSLALLRVAICRRFFCEDTKFNEYFIYDAKALPSFTPLPNPSSCHYVFPDRYVCQSRCLSQCQWLAHQLGRWILATTTGRMDGTSKLLSSGWTTRFI